MVFQSCVIESDRESVYAISDYFDLCFHPNNCKEKKNKNDDLNWTLIGNLCSPGISINQYLSQCV